jgi:error-prone DNA polymerase
MLYTELQVTTNFSFLRGASHPEEMVEAAHALGYAQLAITDRNSFAGIVRAHAAAKKIGLRIIVGAYLEIQDGYDVLVYAKTLQGYASICALLTEGNLRTEKGKCELYKADLFQHLNGVKLIVIPPAQLNKDVEWEPGFSTALQEYKTTFQDDLYIAAHRRYNGLDQKLLYRLAELSTELNIPMVATNDVYYHIPVRRQLQDILTCIREKCTIHNAGFKLHPNAERHLKDNEEMLRLFRHYPDAIQRTTEIAEACRFSLDELKYEYPEEITSEGRSPQEELAFLAWAGARDFFGDLLPEKTIQSIKHELFFIEQMNYAAYFLTVYDIVRFARSKGILCQGRGSAANSTVCFCLGITAVNPNKFDLLFERFISAARNEPPDIDVDFEHERREEVIQYIYTKYGRDRAAIVATVTQQHQKGAIRDVAKAMGLSLDTINKLSATIHRMSKEFFSDNSLKEIGLDLQDKHLRKVLELTQQFIGFPRQLGQHTGGFVISRHKLSKLCPTLNARMANRTCIEWNKDDIDVLGFLKIDILALGMLTCIRKAFDLASQNYGIELTLANIPQDDPAVYEMICHADTIGVFQIESRAQQSMLPRLKPRCFYDLVIEVAIVRPGPIQGDMVHPYLRRRNGEEAIIYPSKELEEILGRTLGVPLFQEQAMKIAIVAAGFTPAEADELRRSMATFKVKGKVTALEEKLIKGMMARGYTAEYAQKVFKQLEGFGSYGFPESHAASFALLVYVSSWIKCFYPDVFATALLNSLPMGFYQPAQIVQDAQKHGVEFRPVDVNFSEWDNTMEKCAGKYFAIRLGFRQLKGLRQQDMRLLISGRGEGFKNLQAIDGIGLSQNTLALLAAADAFQSMQIDRRTALWQLAVQDKPIALFSGHTEIHPEEAAIKLPAMLRSEEVLQDYATSALSLKAHPVSFLREKLGLLHIVKTNSLASHKNGDPIKVAGLVLVRQRPETAKGVWFITIEDETGCANLVVFKNVADTSKKEILKAKLLMAEGILQIEGEVIHVIVKKCYDISRLLSALVFPNTELDLPKLSRADEMSSFNQAKDKQLQLNIFPGARNFR